MTHNKNIPPVPDDALELYSSAVTLSDMEIFVFPEIMYSLVLANLMSPRIWTWRQNPWFADIGKLKPHRRVQRLKQFIIDNYEFNLDLDTWGLTDKARELKRFGRWMDEATISQSNALFGYEGDKYYFDIDIRRHFGLDKYTTDSIPYWKTETVEAMDAFRHKEGFSTGAGECVSLATLYAAALFIVCGIPLEDIFLMATPLHSQNFVTVADGILTNNRRIVTQNMWFNGTEQSSKAQRALRNEQITVVCNNTGYVHCVYPEATIDPAGYEGFKKKLRAFMKTEVTATILANFLRDQSTMQKCFQVRHDSHGKSRYIAAERVYAYEHNSAFKVSDSTREQLLAEIDEDEFFPEPLPERMLLNKFDDFFKGGAINLCDPEQRARLAAALDCQCHKAPDVLSKLAEFVHLEPRFPDAAGARKHVTAMPIAIAPAMSREEIAEYLASIRSESRVADLSFYAARDMTRTDWRPFLKAAFERNPVSVVRAKDLDDDALVAKLETLPNESIYEGPRLAQPDEVWNYGRGDGAEKAVCLANILRVRHPKEAVAVEIAPDSATVRFAGREIRWSSNKGLTKTLPS